MRTVVVAAGLLAIGSAAAAPKYMATALGPPGAVSVSATAINARGQVLGNAVGVDGKSSAFIDTAGIFLPVEVAGADEVVGYAINAHGDVAGCAWMIGGSGRGLVYRAGTAELVPAINGPNRPGCATGINDAGIVVGVQYHDFQYSVPPSYRYFAGTIEDVPQSVAAINNRGDLAGTAYYHTLPSRAWAIIAGVGVSPAPVSNGESWATSLNDRGRSLVQGRRPRNCIPQALPLPCRCRMAPISAFRPASITGVRSSGRCWFRMPTNTRTLSCTRRERLTISTLWWSRASVVSS
jgi:hypothetical protein